ncbi:MAG: HEAT repeat domain-containing protein, partial [Planctomycetota bacterium]|nr:HEAT repeat domain-containing protein [Planctomycetota bacterium]
SVASVRAAAARGLANHDAPESLAALVAALEDAEVPVRQAAAGSLFRLTGADRGFDAEAAPAARAEAVAAWKAWLAER